MAAGDECVYRQAPVDVVVLVSVISALESRSFTPHMTTSSVAVTYAVCFFTPALVSAMVLSGLAGDTLGSSEIITKLFTQLQGSVCILLSLLPCFFLSLHTSCVDFSIRFLPLPLTGDFNTTRGHLLRWAWAWHPPGHGHGNSHCSRAL